MVNCACGAAVALSAARQHLAVCTVAAAAAAGQGAAAVPEARQRRRRDSEGARHGGQAEGETLVPSYTRGSGGVPFSLDGTGGRPIDPAFFDLLFARFTQQMELAAARAVPLAAAAAAAPTAGGRVAAFFAAMTCGSIRSGGPEGDRQQVRAAALLIHVFDPADRADHWGQGESLRPPCIRGSDSLSIALSLTTLTTLRVTTLLTTPTTLTTLTTLTTFGTLTTLTTLITLTTLAMLL